MADDTQGPQSGSIASLLDRVAQLGRSQDEVRKCAVPLWDGGEIPDGEKRCDGRTHLRGPGFGRFAGLCSTEHQSDAQRRVAEEEDRLSAVLDKIAKINGEGTGFEHFHAEKDVSLEGALSAARRFAETPVKQGRAPSRNLLFVGPTGTGKTHLMVRIHLSILAAGYRSEYVTSAEFRELARDEAKREARAPASKWMQRLYRADVVCFDELGHVDGDQRPRGTFAEALLRWLDGMKGCLVATTNCSRTEMMAHSDLGAKAVSRIMANCTIIRMGQNAPDWRLKAITEKRS